MIFEWPGSVASHPPGAWVEELLATDVPHGHFRSLASPSRRHPDQKWLSRQRTRTQATGEGGARNNDEDDGNTVVIMVAGGVIKALVRMHARDRRRRGGWGGQQCAASASDLARGTSLLPFLILVAFMLPSNPSLADIPARFVAPERWNRRATATGLMHPLMAKMQPATLALRGGGSGGGGGWKPSWKKGKAAAGAFEITLALVDKQRFSASSKFPPKEVMDLYKRHGGRFNPANKLWEFSLDKHTNLAQALRSMKPPVNFSD
jgi:hypothetical protein